MKIVAMIRKDEIDEVVGEGPDREPARAAVDAQVPRRVDGAVLSYEGLNELPAVCLEWLPGEPWIREMAIRDGGHS